MRLQKLTKKHPGCWECSLWPAVPAQTEVVSAAVGVGTEGQQLTGLAFCRSCHWTASRSWRGWGRSRSKPWTWTTASQCSRHRFCRHFSFCHLTKIIKKTTTGQDLIKARVCKSDFFCKFIDTNIYTRILHSNVKCKISHNCIFML